MLLLHVLAVIGPLRALQVSAGGKGGFTVVDGTRKKKKMQPPPPFILWLPRAHAAVCVHACQNLQELSSAVLSLCGCF